METLVDFNIEKNNDYIRVKLNPKIYSLDVVYSAAYIFLDKAYIVIDGDPLEEILITIKAKDVESDLEKLAFEFYNELIINNEYKDNFEKNKEIRQIILQRALITNDTTLLYDFDEDLFSEKADIEDFDDIATPWEEKYSNNKNE